MKMKIQSLLTALLLLVGAANSQCVMTSAYGTATAPTTAGAINISTCSFWGEYSTINGVQAATTYICTVTGPGYVTITEGSPSGPIIAFGSSPLTWSSTNAGTYYAHWAQNASCGTAFSCQTTTIDYVGPSSACTNPAVAGAAQSSPAMACPGQNFNLSLTGASSNPVIWVAVLTGSVQLTAESTNPVSLSFSTAVTCSSSGKAVTASLINTPEPAEGSYNLLGCMPCASSTL